MRTTEEPTTLWRWPRKLREWSAYRTRRFKPLWLVLGDRSKYHRRELGKRWLKENGRTTEIVP
jgi:hypothetical protein